MNLARITLALTISLADGILLLKMSPAFAAELLASASRHRRCALKTQDHSGATFRATGNDKTMSAAAVTQPIESGPLFGSRPCRHGSTLV